MKQFRTLFMSLLSVGFSLTAFAPFAEATFVPQNEIHYESLPKGMPNVTEQDFLQILAQIQNAYSSAVSLHGGRLSIEGDWRSEQANAGATQRFGTWLVKVTGGLARRPELTSDALTLVVCHELGHHLAGFPFMSSPMPFGPKWMASEGQADYFSSQVCARKLWGPETQKNSEFRSKVDPVAQKGCDTVWTTTDERDLCYRIAVATESAMVTMATLKQVPYPKFDTPDHAIVTQTFKQHPEVQCRLDTLFQASLCKASFDEKVIPGKEARGGAEGVEAETQASQYSCTKKSGFEVGLRPACWFKARM